MCVSSLFHCLPMASNNYKFRVSQFMKAALERSSLRRATVTALVVGTALNVINADLANPNIYKILLTYCVPFLVAAYSATSARLSFNPGAQAVAGAKLFCASCEDTEIAVEKNDIIPQCPRCKNGTHWKS